MRLSSGFGGRAARDAAVCALRTVTPAHAHTAVPGWPAEEVLRVVVLAMLLHHVLAHSRILAQLSSVGLCGASPVASFCCIVTLVNGGRLLHGIWLVACHLPLQQAYSATAAHGGHRVVSC